MLASNILCGVLDLYLRCHQLVNGSCLAECVVCSTDVRFTRSIPLFRGYHLHSCLCFGAGIDEGCPPAPSGIVIQSRGFGFVATKDLFGFLIVRPDECYSRNSSCALNLICVFFYSR